METTQAIDRFKDMDLRGRYLILGAVALIVVGGVLVALTNDNNDFLSAEEIAERGYIDVDSEEFLQVVNQPDTYTLDVHIPQHTEHIPGTDAFIPYDELEAYAEHLPDDKETWIAIYCRSDNMSHQAAAELAEMGYENIYHLEGGVLAWDADGFDRVPMHFEEPGLYQD